MYATPATYFVVAEKGCSALVEFGTIRGRRLKTDQNFIVPATEWHEITMHCGFTFIASPNMAKFITRHCTVDSLGRVLLLNIVIQITCIL